MANGDQAIGAPGQGVSPAGKTAGQEVSPARAAEREKIGELAREFEAFFVVQMVRQMRQSMLEDENGQGLGAGTMTETFDVELGRTLANTGGIGLAQVLQTAIERQVGTTGATAGLAMGAVPVKGDPTASAIALKGDPTAKTTAAGPSAVVKPTALGPAPNATPAGAAALPLPVTAPISSTFGWRSDPFHGATRFHAGVDIAAAYGREVPAAGGGQVVFSGVQGGYGNTVVIEHPGGVRTRYAHLSSIQVETGERVKAGTVVGRVGSSGRSTGPHLHFEVLQDGHPVNPEVAATRYAGQLKFGGMVADFPLDQPSAHGVAAGVDDEDSGQ